MIKFDTSSAWRWILDDANNARRCGISLAALSLWNTHFQFIQIFVCSVEWITSAVRFRFPYATRYSRKAMTIIFVRLRPVWHWRGAHLTSARSIERVKIDWYGSYNGHDVFIWRPTHAFFILSATPRRVYWNWTTCLTSFSIFTTYLLGSKINGQTHNCLPQTRRYTKKISFVSYKSRKKIKI